jgi:poly(3-hydroxybutyrate) depolymerase
VRGDGDSAQKHREFYDEDLAVMDLAAEFSLQTVETVFVRHDLPKGNMTHIEGEKDDISGVGQTEAAHGLCPNIPPERKAHWLQPAVGHYGVFNGSRFRAEIVPRIADFVLSNNGGASRGEERPTGRSRTAATGAGNGSARLIAAARAKPMQEKPALKS